MFFPTNFVKLNTKLKQCSSNTLNSFDCLVIIGPDFEFVYDIDFGNNALEDAVKLALDGLKIADESYAKELSVSPVIGREGQTFNLKRIVFAPTGKLDRDYDDVRSYEKAGELAIERVMKCGSSKPLLVVSKIEGFVQCELVAALGALKACYVPVEVRERTKVDTDDGWVKLKQIDLLTSDSNVCVLANTLETARCISRDIGGSDPERMAPPRVEEYVRELFAQHLPCVSVEVVSGQSKFEKEYPCFAVVNRAASVISRHEGRILYLKYDPPNCDVDTLMLVGKGVTYDTGGADIKAGGIMAGMSRDKCGAADVAAIVYAVAKLSELKMCETPKRIIGAMTMVRNSVGANCYVSDEIIVSRAGVPLRVGNTDAEGRMAMADVLCYLKEMAISSYKPEDVHLMTIATLTGHHRIAHGNYSTIMDNGPATKVGFADSVQRSGDKYGDMFEISTVRKEDFEFVKDRSGKFVDVLQSRKLATGRVPRGHQIPSAFLQTVSGLDKHMCRDKIPLKYSHVDIAGSSGGLPGITSASSVIAIAMKTLRLSR